MQTSRRGYEESVGRFRAKARTVDPSFDRSDMVQELVARLRFAASKTAFSGKSILDYGCGTGLALQWLRLHTDAEKLVGVDISEGAIKYAKARYPGIDFRVLNIEQPSPDLYSEFDLVLSFEVLEHLLEPNAALRQAAYYLRANGVLVISTPNRTVFSAGMEPSPINATHIHEMDIEEFEAILQRHFTEVSVWGMRLRDQDKRLEHTRQVRHACEGFRALGDLWWNKHVNRFYRWIWRGEVFHRQLRHWRADDFEFTRLRNEISTSALWFFAVCRGQISGAFSSLQ